MVSTSVEQAIEEQRLDGQPTEIVWKEMSALGEEGTEIPFVFKNIQNILTGR